MENLGRREFIATALCMCAPSLWAAKRHKIHIQLPQKPFEYFIKKGKLPGKRLLVIGGIHGNEIGAYKSADLLVDTQIQKGELIIVPRSNFISILAKTRGYNGDMNRKFEKISPDDPDFIYVTALKELILQTRPDVVISMHDGVGFHRTNPIHWGQCVVIDERRFGNFELEKKANIIIEKANRTLLPREQLTLYNTYTFSKNIHKEQKLALTGWCLKQGIEAYCIESSRNLPLARQMASHLAMLDAIFELFDIRISPSIQQLKQESLQSSKRPKLTLFINETAHTFTRSTRLHIKKGSNIKVAIEGPRGSYLVPRGINLNWNSFFFSKPLDFEMKHDYKRVFKLEVVPT